MVKKIALHILYLAVIAAYAFLIGCPLKRFTGLDCAFCGMTRAHLAFFSGNFKEAFAYHELFFLGIPFFLGIAHMRIFKRRKSLYIADICFVVLCAVGFIVRYIIILI